MRAFFHYCLLLTLAVCRCAADGTNAIEWGPQTNWVKMAIRVMGPQTLTRTDILNMPELIGQMKRNSNTVSSTDVLSRDLWRKFSSNELLKLANYEPASSNAASTENLVLGALNGLIQGPRIHPGNSIWIPPEFEAGLMGMSPSGLKLTRFNRLLVEDNYPRDVSRTIKAGDPAVHIGHQVMLTILLTNCSSIQTSIFHLTRGEVERVSEYSFNLGTPSGKNIDIKIPSGGGSSMIIRLKPTNCLEITYNLSAIYDFEEIGTYTIIANRWFDDFRAVSNPLKIRLISDLVQ